MSNLVYIVPHADLYDFAIVSSRMHMAWMKVVCGRLKSDYRYSRDMCYNTFVWPENISDQQKAYGRKFKDDADRVAHLFELYKVLTEK